MTDVDPEVRLRSDPLGQKGAGVGGDGGGVEVEVGQQRGGFPPGAENFHGATAKRSKMNPRETFRFATIVLYLATLYIIIL